MTKSPKVGEFEHLLPVERRHGFSVKRLPKSGFIIVEIDYFTDPAKDNPEYAAKLIAEIGAKQFAVEFGRSWETYAGSGVYDKIFYKHIHVRTQPYLPKPGYPIFRGWDFGANQSVAIAQLNGPQLNVLAELPNGGLNTRLFAPEVIAYCNDRFGADTHFIDIVDPSAFWEGKTAEGKACTDIMREFGLSPIPASTNDPQKRIDAVTELMLRPFEDERCLMFNPECTMLIDGCAGAYHFPEKPSQSRKADRPVKNIYSHIQDGLQYLALRIKQHKEDRSESVQYEASKTNIRYKFSK